MVHVSNISIYMYLYHPPAAAIFSRAKISAAIEGSGCLCANLHNMWFSWQLHSIPHPCFPGFGQLPPGSKGSRFPSIRLKKSLFFFGANAKGVHNKVDKQSPVPVGVVETC